MKQEVGECNPSHPLEPAKGHGDRLTSAGSSPRPSSPVLQAIASRHGAKTCGNRTRQAPTHPQVGPLLKEIRVRQGLGLGVGGMSAFTKLQSII